MPDEAIVVQDVSHRYEAVRAALEGVSFSVPAGTIHGLLGPNGSGKTTLFRLLSTIAPIQSGKITLAGLDVATQQALVRQRLGVVFQSPALDPHLTATENLIHHGHLYGLRGADLRARVGRSLAAMGLGDRAGDRVHTFSGGMKRRVELAKGLLHEPQVLLLDEPSTGLDPGARQELWEQLRRARERTGVTMLLSTHLMDEAEKCDVLSVLSRGRLVADGSPDALKARVGGEVVRVIARNPVAAQGRLAEQYPERFTLVEGTLRAEIPGAHRELARVAEVVGDDLIELTVGRPTLEDVFLRLTGRSLRGEEAGVGDGA